MQRAVGLRVKHFYNSRCLFFKCLLHLNLLPQSKDPGDAPEDQKTNREPESLAHVRKRTRYLPRANHHVSFPFSQLHRINDMNFYSFLDIRDSEVHHVARSHSGNNGPDFFISCHTYSCPLVSGIPNEDIALDAHGRNMPDPATSSAAPHADTLPAESDTVPIGE
jgi:hypothetical protein